MALLLSAALAIGWRKLPRDDGRRALHYGIVLALMLLLNQRSWDHHAGYLVLADLAIVYALFRGRIGKGLRRACGIVMAVSAGALIVLSGSLVDAVFGPGAGDRLEAYGLAFWHFLAVYVLCMILALRLKPTKNPYDVAGPPVTSELNQRADKRTTLRAFAKV